MQLTAVLNRTTVLKLIGAFFLIWTVSLWAALLTGVSLWAASGSQDSVVNEDAFVYILNIGIQSGQQNSLSYSGLRNGFAPGNGRYIVTAAHCVDDFENSSQSLEQPMILSPYYGDIFEARIVAVDKENDIAILEPAWDGHPALRLETSEKIQSSKKITIAGYPPTGKERGGDGTHCSRRIRFERVPLLHADGQGADAISVGPVKYAGEGWSGSPLIVPESGCVAGVTCIKMPKQKSLKLFRQFKIPLRSGMYIGGCHSDAVRALFLKNGLTLEGPQQTFPKADGRNDFDKILGLLDTFKPDQQELVKTALDNLCREMPESYFTRLIPGMILDAPQSESSFEEAIHTAPRSAFVRAAYGNSLRSRGRHNEAVAQFEQVTQQDPNHVFAFHGRLAALVQIDPNSAETLGTELTQRWPQNAAFWFEWSRALRANNKRREELPIIQKAVELSEKTPYLYQRCLADSLAANGRNEEAEQAYEELLKTHECENCWIAYGSALLVAGPARVQRAQEAFAKAKSFNSDPNKLPDRYSVYEQKIKEMLSDPNTLQQQNSVSSSQLSTANRSK